MNILESTCAHHGPVSHVRMRPGPGTRLWRWFRRSRRYDRAVHWPDTFDLTVPAMGDGYNFAITVHFTWCVTGRDHSESLVARTLDNRTQLLERLAAKVREVSRHFAPYDAGPAEGRIDRVVGELFRGAVLTFASGSVTGGEARPIEHRTMLRLDKPVREAQQNAWSRRQEAVNEHEHARLLASQFGERREIWRRFLESGEADWRTPYAVALAKEPDSVAETIKRMTEDRRAQAKELADHVVGQVHEYQDRDSFDLMLQNDRVLRHLMQLIGIPGLPPPNPSPFDETSME